MLQVCEQVATRLLSSGYEDVFALLVPCSCCDKSATSCYHLVTELMMVTDLTCYNVCDVTLSVHPHRASWKVSLATVGIEPATLGYQSNTHKIDLLQIVSTRLMQAVHNKLLRSRACCHQLVNRICYVQTISGLLDQLVESVLALSFIKLVTRW